MLFGGRAPPRPPGRAYNAPAHPLAALKLLAHSALEPRRLWRLTSRLHSETERSGSFFPIRTLAMLTSMKSNCARDTVTLLQRETPEIIPQRCGHPIHRIWIRWTTVSWVSFKRVYRLQIHDVNELKECLLREWRLLDHSIIAAAIAQWWSRLRACVHVNGGHFEHKFWTCAFLMFFVCFVGTGFRKLDWYKYASASAF